jgi:hypothetical protein
VRALWITKRFILISEMKVQVIDHFWNIVRYVHFLLNLFLLNRNWRHIQSCHKHENFAEKSLSEKFRARYFQNRSSLFFWNLDTFIDCCYALYKLVFFSVSITLSVLYHPFKSNFTYFAVKNWTFAFVGGPWCPTLDFVIAFWIMIYVSHIVYFAILYITGGALNRV